MSVSGGVQTLTDRINAEVTAFGRDPVRAQKALRDLHAADRTGFCRAVLPVLKQGDGEAAPQFLYEMLKDALPFCDPALLSLEDDLAIARVVMQRDSLLDVKLARRITNTELRGGDGIDNARALRILEVLAVIADGTRILPMLIQVLREPDPRLRSKAALLVGRTSKNLQWVEQALREPDARLRANTIEALWSVDSEAVRAVLRAALRDPNNRVLGNALLGLYRLGDAGAIEPMLKMAEHPAPLFRATAAWVMGETADPRFLPTLARMVREADTNVRRHVFRALSQLKKATCQCALAPALRISLCQAVSQPDGARLLRAGVSLVDGGEVAKLPPTGVVLWEGQHMIANYSLRRPRLVDSLALGVALPAASPGFEENCAVLERGAQACLALKGGADRWAILRFGAPVEAAEGKTLRPACALRSDPDVLSTTLTAPQEQLLFADVVPDLLRAVAHASGSRNLLLLADCTDGAALPELDAARWAGLVRDAQAAAVAIHAVTLTGPAGSPGILTDASQQTGGMCLATSKSDRIPELCGKLYSTLLHPYEILYHPNQAEPAHSLKLQVYSEQGCGEDTLEGEPESGRLGSQGTTPPQDSVDTAGGSL